MNTTCCKSEPKPQDGSTVTHTDTQGGEKKSSSPNPFHSFSLRRIPE